ncbi:MAG: YtfJ family protein [Polyangiaceae bacterium]
MNTRWTRWCLLLVALGGAPLALALDARAATVGDSAPDARVEDADENKLWVSDLSGSVAVIFYEDKDSGETNREMKDELASLMAEDGMGGIRVVPIADVTEYNSWPAKGFVKKAIREESKKVGLTIYCDWDGSFREKLDLSKGTSNVVVLAKDGTVRFADSGGLSGESRKQVLSILRAEMKK